MCSYCILYASTQSASVFIPHHLLSDCMSANFSLCTLSALPLSLSFHLCFSLRVSKRDFDHFNSLIKLTGSPEKTSSRTRVDVREVTLS